MTCCTNSSLLSPWPVPRPFRAKSRLLAGPLPARPCLHLQTPLHRVPPNLLNMGCRSEKPSARSHFLAFELPAVPAPLCARPSRPTSSSGLLTSADTQDPVQTFPDAEPPVTVGLSFLCGPHACCSVTNGSGVPLSIPLDREPLCSFFRSPQGTGACPLAFHFWKLF